VTLPAPAVVLDSISKTYGNIVAVDNVSLSIAGGELLTLLGPSGCGKTTILRMIAGFVRPGSGDIRIMAKRVNDLPPNKRHVGLMFQSYALFPHMTVGENVAFGLKMQGMPRADIKSRVVEALESVRLHDRSEYYPRQLSGGQQQRVALARALVIKPDVLLLDEPFGALDRELRQHLQQETRRLQRRLGISTLLVTHDQEEAVLLSDRIAIMNGGRIEQIGSAADVFERPSTRFAAEFLGATNLFPGRVQAAAEGATFVLDCDGTVIPLGPNRLDSSLEAKMLMVRPERVGLSAPSDPPPASKETTCLKGRVTDSAYLGAAIEYRVSFGGSSAEIVARLASGAPTYQRDQQVTIALPRDAMRLID
jgi:putative spermidine/putrescine transport system ATP-binding protein